MHLHDVLVYYRDSHYVAYSYESHVFQNGYIDNWMSIKVVANDNIRPRGRRLLSGEGDFRFERLAHKG